MADYKVGNLQIVFNAVDETSKSFDNLAKNLNAVKKAISNIGSLSTSDLNKFGDSLDKIREKFSPLLADINGASVGLTAFNEVTNRLGIKNVSDVAKALQEVNVVAEETKKAIGEENATIGEGNQVLQETKNIVKDIWSTFSNDTIQSTLDLQKQEQQVLKNKIAFLELALADEKLRTAEDGTKFSTQELKEELKKLKKELGNTQKDTKKSTSGFSKLFASIKRIALYRILRTVLKEIAQAFTETIKAFAQVDDGVNDTMSQLTSSLSIIKLSFGATLLPLLEMITPIIQEIGIALANVANMVSQAMSTTGTYTKINTDYIKDYRKELEKTGGLLDFDKIRSLTKKSGGLGDFLIPDQEVDKNNESISRLSETLQHIKNIISEVWEVIKQGWEIVKPYIESALEIIEKVVKKINELGLTKPLIYGIVIALTALGASKIITGIKNLTGAFNAWGIAIASVALGIAVLANWDEFNAQTKRTITIVSALVAVFTSLAIAIMAAQGALTLGTGIPLILAAAVASAVTIRGLVDKDIYTYANGGAVPNGTLFYAGEAGAETVTVGSSGRTEVTNVSQMEEALYNALVRYGNQNRDSGTGAININIDGQKVFEATRRVANRRGLDYSRI